jgi:hypothetical protein
MSVLALKKFPDAFPNDVNEILNTMSFTNGEKIHLIGSMSIRSQLYAGDYDTYEIIETLSSSKFAIGIIIVTIIIEPPIIITNLGSKSLFPLRIYK